MDSFETECRRLIDGLVRQIVALVDEVAEDELTRARAARAAAERAAAPRVSARLARALERAEERRRLAAERRAAMALRPKKTRRTKAATGSTSLTESLEAEAKKLEPASPPPLFVHKRSRDGSIQQLERNANDSVPPPPPA